MLSFKNLGGFFNFIEGRHQIYYHSNSLDKDKLRDVEIKERPGRDLNPSPKLDRLG